MRWINPENKKHLSLVTWAIKKPYAPSFIRVPISVEEAEACVVVGENVVVGQVLARPLTSEGVFVHAGISGEVTRIQNFPHPLKGETLSIEIQSDGKSDLFHAAGMEKINYENYSADDMATIFQEKGIVDLASHSPLHHLAGMLHNGLLVLNGCESEPYVTSDHALMMSHPLEILKGAEILRKFLGAAQVAVVLEDNKLEVAELIRSKMYFLKWKHFDAYVFPARYPQGAAPILLQSLKKRTSWQGEAKVLGVDTAFAVYEAMALQKPFFERVVTVGGECVADAHNVWMPIGASFESAIRACRGLLREPRKLVMGGPMAGTAQRNWHVPIISSTTAILALPKEVSIPHEISACTRCGDCNDACPAGISPAMIALAAEKGLFELAADWGADSCFECGNCSYVCPSKRPMVELMRYADSRERVNQPAWAEKNIDLERDFLKTAALENEVPIETKI